MQYTANNHGHEKLNHGHFEITIVSDGFIVLPSGIIMPEAEPQIASGILARLGGGLGSAPLHANIPIIKFGDELIIIDTGSGANFQDTAGALVENIKRIGLEPASITKVVITHAHPDHTGGTTISSDGLLAFPNAHYYASEIEYKFWTDVSWEHLIADGLKPFVEGAKRDFAAVAGRLTLVKDQQEIVSGMRVISTPGHTPGHISISLEDKTELIITGDALANPVVSFEHPDWRFGFDADHDVAVETRRNLLGRISSDRSHVLGYHWQYPGLGNIERSGSAYRLIMRT